MLWPAWILVLTDFSEYSDRTLRQALDIVKQYGSKVNVLHVVHEEPPFVSGFGSVPGAADKIIAISYHCYANQSKIRFTLTQVSQRWGWINR